MSNLQKSIYRCAITLPIEKKDYSNNQYIASSWENAKYFLANAFTITIFGYGAPTTDSDAVELLCSAWLNDSPRTLEHIEIVDIENTDVLAERWGAFTPTLHYSLISNLKESRLLRWPRRSCEALFSPITQGMPCEDFPLPSTNNRDELHQYITKIANYEK